MPSPQALGALLGSMILFSARFAKFTDKKTPLSLPIPLLFPPAHFERIAIKPQEKALRDCGDELPPLSLLQSFILTSFQHLIRGVRGTAWRHLGTTIRLAYELDLHCIDSAENSASGHNASKVIEIEERRRAWWAIWEMDTFASIIRRSPTAINWPENETFLPIKDDLWYSGTEHPSCFLALKPMARWKNLQKTGNESCKAWFIVANSLMRDAQIFSDPRGLFTKSKRLSSTSDSSGSQSNGQKVSEDLSVISNSLRCLTLAVPKALQYHGEYLAFASNEDPTITGIHRQLDGSKHDVYLIIQLTHLTIDHFKAFRSSSGDSHISLHERSSSNSSSRQQQQTDILTLSEQQRQALNRFVLAADKAFNMVSRCTEDYIQHTNPFLASLIWIAAAVQLVQKYFQPSDANLDLVDSKFEFLRMIYKQYVDFWETPSVLGERLNVLEQQFEKLHTLEKDLPSTQSDTSFNSGRTAQRSQEGHGVHNIYQNPLRSYITNRREESTNPEASDLPHSILPSFPQEVEPHSALASLANASFLARDPLPSPPQSGKTFEESASFPYADGNFNNFGFGLQAGGELDFPIFLNSLFSGSFDQN